MIRCARCALVLLLLLLCNEWLEKKIWNALALSSGSSFSFPEKLKRSLRIEKKNHLLIIFARFYLFRARIRYRQEPRGFQIINREGGMIVLSLNPVEAHHSNYISCQYICCLYSSKSHKSWSYLKKVFKKWISYVKLYIGFFFLLHKWKFRMMGNRYTKDRYQALDVNGLLYNVYPKLFHPNPHHV